MSSNCDATMVSEAIPDHVHTCLGHHDLWHNHKCPECVRWWWTSKTLAAEDEGETA